MCVRACVLDVRVCLFFNVPFVYIFVCCMHCKNVLLRHMCGLSLVKVQFNSVQFSSTSFILFMADS